MKFSEENQTRHIEPHTVSAESRSCSGRGCPIWEILFTCQILLSPQGELVSFVRIYKTALILLVLVLQYFWHCINPNVTASTHTRAFLVLYNKCNGHLASLLPLIHLCSRVVLSERHQAKKKKIYPRIHLAVIYSSGPIISGFLVSSVQIMATNSGFGVCQKCLKKMWCHRFDSYKKMEM